jgi:diaminopropionate ammonia-lyase
MPAVLCREGSERAVAEISSWPDYRETPLLSLPGLAADLRVAEIFYKDEAGRFGLGSFKSLGGAYAVYRLLESRIRETHSDADVSAAGMASARFDDCTSGVTVCCATDGNHGRSVAWGAKKFHCRCVIYLHEHVSAGREHAIALLGAEIVRTPGGYDDSVRQAAADAARNGWTVVSDTSWPGYESIPRDVMHGYTLMAQEVIRRIPDGPPSHVFVQSGVGGVAAAVCASLWWAFEAQRPLFVSVEPARAACLLESARAGGIKNVPIWEETVMACLSAGEPSRLAWQLLETGADAFMTVPEEAAPEAMRVLAEGQGGDDAVVAGESGAAGVAALMTARRRDEFSHRLGLNRESRVLLFGTEGATDPEIYRRLVGRHPGEVAGTGR